MKFIRNHWYQLGLIIFIVLAFWALFHGEQPDLTQKLLLASLMALPLHQFEEYELPGGGPLVINKVFWGEKKHFLNYPGNWNSIMIVNLSAYIFYIAALLLPKMLWLGLARTDSPYIIPEWQNQQFDKLSRMFHVGGGKGKTDS